MPKNIGVVEWDGASFIMRNVETEEDLTRASDEALIWRPSKEYHIVLDFSGMPFNAGGTVASLVPGGREVTRSFARNSGLEAEYAYQAWIRQIGGSVWYEIKSPRFNHAAKQGTNQLLEGSLTLAEDVRPRVIIQP